MDARKTKRRRKGSAIAEFGPALFLFLIIIFFPMLDFLGLLASYCMGWYCNFATCRELAVRKQADETTVYGEIFTNISGTGLAPFLGIKSQADLSSTAVYTPSSNGQQPLVTCTTTVNANPFISIPWWGTVPGMNAPMQFSISSSRPREVTQ